MLTRHLWYVARETFEAWDRDNVSRLAASLAYYTLLSLAPLVVLAVFVSGLAFGEDAARGNVARELSGIVGPQAAAGIQAIVDSAHRSNAGWLASGVGLLVLLFGASGVFGELQSAFNVIWSAPAREESGLLRALRQRAISFLAVLGVALLLLALTLVSAAVSTLGTVSEHALAGGGALWQAVDFGVSFAIALCLFALVFKYLPDVEVAWSGAWRGGAVTALLFVIGKSLVGMYLGRSSIASLYGGAGSLVALLVWVYYSAQILFVGVELTQIYTRRKQATDLSPVYPWAPRSPHVGRFTPPGL